MPISRPQPEAPPGKVGAVMAYVRETIARKNLRAGAPLPSIRQCAETNLVSKSTVVEAYDRLTAQGEIGSRPGSGFFVIGRARPLSLADPGLPLEREIDPLWVMRSSVDTDDSTLKPGCGWLPDAWMPADGIRRALRAQARGPAAALLNYSQPLGFLPLREHLSRQLGERGIAAEAAQILLSDSGTQAIDLLCRLFIQPGDAVLVDDPCYFNFLNIARAHRAKIIGVPYTSSGPDLARFAAALAEHQPRLYITTGALQNPTGASPSAATQHRILKLAEAHDLVIIEDDVFADFETQPTSRLAAFDGFDRVAYVGSYSKTLSASLRCGFIAARSDWIDDLADLRLSTTYGGSEVAARVVHRLLVDGSYRRHTESIRAQLAVAATRVSRHLAGAGLKLWCEPNGGLFLWTELPDGLGAAEVARRAVKEGVLLAPGDVFSPNHGARSHLRFNVSQCADPRVFEVLMRAMRDTGLKSRRKVKQDGVE